MRHSAGASQWSSVRRGVNVWVHSADVESLSNGAASNADSAIVMNSYDLIGSFTLTSEFGKDTTGSLRHGVTYFIFVGDAACILPSVVTLNLFLATGMD